MNIVVEHDGVMRIGIPVFIAAKDKSSVVAVVIESDLLSIAVPLEGMYKVKNELVLWVPSQALESLKKGSDVIIDDYIVQPFLDESFLKERL